MIDDKQSDHQQNNQNITNEEWPPKDPQTGGSDDASVSSSASQPLATEAEITHSPYDPYFPPQPSVPDGSQAVAGEPLEKGATKASMEDILTALKTVYDPEIPVNIHDLGLIYSCDMEENGDVEIYMTLTAPACPVAGEMPGEVAETVAALEGIGVVTVTLTWSPPWNQDRMSEDARLALGLF